MPWVTVYHFASTIGALCNYTLHLVQHEHLCVRSSRGKRGVVQCVRLVNKIRFCCVFFIGNQKERFHFEVGGLSTYCWHASQHADVLGACMRGVHLHPRDPAFLRLLNPLFSPTLLTFVVANFYWKYKDFQRLLVVIIELEQILIGKN